MFHTKKAPAALEILSAHKGEFTDFEVKNGTLNEVFLAITAIVQRNLLNYIRSKGRVLGSLFMSMFMLVMFSFLMKSTMSGLDASMNYLISGISLWGPTR